MDNKDLIIYIQKRIITLMTSSGRAVNVLAVNELRSVLRKLEAMEESKN